MSYTTTWKQVILNPNEFFRNMSTNKEYTSPITFALIDFAIMAILVSLFLSSLLRIISPSASIFGFIFFFILSIIIYFTSLLLNSFILHRAYKFLDGNGTYKETLGMLCYAWAPFVLVGVPAIGWLISLYAIYLNIIGGMTVHNIDLKKSILACVLCYIGFFILGIIFVGFIMSIYSVMLHNITG